MKIKSHRLISNREILLFFVDYLIVAWFIAIQPLHKTVGMCFLDSIAAFLPYFFVYYIFDLYDLNRDYRNGREIVRVAAVVVVGFILSLFIFFFVDFLYRAFHLFLFINVFLLMPAWRYLFTYIRTIKPVKKCLIVGTGKIERDTLSLIRQNPYSDLQVVGFVDTEIEKRHREEEGDVKVLGSYSEIRDIVEKYGIKMLIVTSVENLPEELLTSLIEINETGIEVTTTSDILSQLTNRIPLFCVNTKWEYLMVLNKSNYYRQPLKRALDIFGAVIGILLSIPFYIIVSPLIKLTSKGPVFYKQERLGIYRSVFKTLKFRTMVYNSNVNGYCSTLDNDSRITKIGRVLRRMKIDEIPQFINILKGEMSLVGPRPVSKEEAEKNLYEKKVPFWDLRFYLKPGLSGWAQVHYPYGTTIEEAMRRMEYELFYIKNNSFFLDLLVILKTFRSIFHLRGR